MAFGSVGGSESTTKQKTLNLDNRMVVSDQGVINSPRNSGNPRNFGNIRLGSGATYSPVNNITNSGLDDTTLKQIQGLLGPKGMDSVPVTDGGIGQVVADRVNDQVENAPIEASKAKSNYILFGAIFLVVVLAVALGFTKKKR